MVIATITADSHDFHMRLTLTKKEMYILYGIFNWKEKKRAKKIKACLHYTAPATTKQDIRNFDEEMFYLIDDILPVHPS